MKPFKQINTDNNPLMQMQDNLRDVLNPLVKNELVQGSLISNLSLSGTDTDWQSWFPRLLKTDTSATGYGATGSMTFTGVTTMRGRYQVKDCRAQLELWFVGTTGGIASNTITFKLPLEYPALRTDTTSHATLTKSLVWAMDGVPITATAEVLDADPTIVRIQRLDGANWGLGAGREISVSLSYEVDPAKENEFGNPIARIPKGLIVTKQSSIGTVRLSSNSNGSILKIFSTQSMTADLWIF